METCGRSFQSAHAHEQHCSAVGHWCCPICTRVFGSQGALEQHRRDTGHDDACKCGECDRVFGSVDAMEQHRRDTHGSPVVNKKKKKKKKKKKQQKMEERAQIARAAPVDPPIPGLAGMWVTRDEFDGHKSFGRFVCAECSKWWMTAHAFVDYTQGCKACETHSYPVWMWENFDHADRRGDRDDSDDKPHDMQRCAACAAGVCTANRYSDSDSNSDYLY